MKRRERTHGTVHVGTSGWTYDSWRTSFYPKDVPQRLWLRYLGGRFSAAEINASFYRTPTPEAVRAWRAETPVDFVFTWKASRFITHWKRLNANCDTSIALMETRLKLLGPKLAAVLFQLPPQLHKDRARLAAFLQMLPRRHRYAFEFRHSSWYADDILALLHAENAALCFSDHGDAPAPWELTTDFVYVRGHGPTGRYHGHYPDRTLRRWANAMAAWRAAGCNILIFFDNDQKAAAPQDAARLRDFLSDVGAERRASRRQITAAADVR